MNLSISSSAHQTTNSMNSEFQFPQFKVLQSVFIFLCKELLWHFLMYFGLNLKLLSCQYLLTKKVNKNSLQKFKIRIGCSYEVNGIKIFIKIMTYFLGVLIFGVKKRGDNFAYFHGGDKSLCPCMFGRPC